MKTDIIKTKLEEERNLLEGELSKLGKVDKTGDWEATPEEETTGPQADENDLFDKTEEYEERSSTLDSLEKRLANINKALLKIKNGNYGICEVCGKKIEEDRLEANPAALTCKEDMEKI